MFSGEKFSGFLVGISAAEVAEIISSRSSQGKVAPKEQHPKPNKP